MVYSVSGVHGQNVPSHVGEVLHFEKEIVLIQLHDMGVDNVRDQPMKQKYATQIAVQVSISFLICINYKLKVTRKMVNSVKYM